MKIIDNNIKTLTIEEIFNLEYKIHKILSKIKRSSKGKEAIYYYKNILIDINNIKDEYDLTNIDLKLRYLKKEYNFLIKLNKIKSKEINCLKRKLLIKRTYDKISINDSTLPKFNKYTSKNYIIRQYEKNIELLLKNKMIYDGKLYQLENLYSKLIKKS